MLRRTSCKAHARGAQRTDERARESDATVTALREASRRRARMCAIGARRVPLGPLAHGAVSSSGVEAEGPGEMEPCQWAALESFTAGLERTPQERR